MKVDTALQNSTDTALSSDIYSKEMLSELNKREKSIRTALSGIDKNFEKIAFNLYWIYTSKAYKAMGCESITDYALQKFDFCKTSTYSFINVVERFAARSGDGTVLDAFDKKYKGYSSSKLSVISDLTDKQIDDLGIKSDMSVREIKKLVKQLDSGNAVAESSASVFEITKKPDAELEIQRTLIVEGNKLSMPEPEPDFNDDDADCDEDGIKGYTADMVYEFSVLDDERAIVKKIKAILKQNKAECEEAFFSLILRCPVRKGE